MLKRKRLIRFGDAIIIEGFYAYKNYLIGIRYGVIPLIIPKKNFRFNRLEGLISYPLFIFNSKNVEKEKKRYRRLVKKLVEEGYSEIIRVVRWRRPYNFSHLLPLPLLLFSRSSQSSQCCRCYF